MKETDEDLRKKKDREEKLRIYEKEMEGRDILEEEEIFKNRNNDEPKYDIQKSSAISEIKLARKKS